MIGATVSIDVPDLNRAVEFYTRALGLSVAREPTATSAIVATDALQIHLLVREAGSNPVEGSPAQRSFERHWTPVHLDFLLDDVQGTAARVVEHGGAHEGGASGDWGEIAYCADPFGNGFCVIRE